jgi:type I restriction enzyme M protein
MNMILHGNEVADIQKSNTITNPQFTRGGELRTFDFAVANPPFSDKSWSNGLELDYGRFEFGRPPAKNGDYAFLLHILKSLKSTGKAAAILPHGVLFRGNAEAAIRKQLLRRGYIKGVIGLPANLFYGTGIPACIVVLDKENAQARTGVFMIDASNGFLKDGPKNRLRSQDIHKIVDVFTKQTEIERYSRMVLLAEIADPKNDYNLNIPRYIDSAEPEDIQDLHAHLHGGIPDRDLDALSGYWDAFPSLRATLFTANRSGYSDLAVDVNEIQQTVLDSDEFTKYTGPCSPLGSGATKYKTDLIPPALVVARYFSDEQAKVDELNVARRRSHPHHRGIHRGLSETISVSLLTGVSVPQ